MFSYDKYSSFSCRFEGQTQRLRQIKKKVKDNNDFDENNNDDNDYVGWLQLINDEFLPICCFNDKDRNRNKDRDRDSDRDRDIDRERHIKRQRQRYRL